MVKPAGALPPASLLNYHPLSNAYTTSLTADELLKFIRSTGHEPQVLAF